MRIWYALGVAMKPYISRIIIALSCTLFLVSCGSGNRDASIAQIIVRHDEYVDAMKQIETKNLSVSDDLVLSVPELVVSGEYICADDYQKNAEIIFSHYVSAYDAENMTMDPSYYPPGPDYFDPATGLSMSVGSNGFFSYMTKGFSPEEVFGKSENQLVKTYPFEELDSRDHYVLVEGDDVSVADARRLVQGFSNDYVEASGFGNGLRVLRINLYRNDSGYYYEVDLSQTVDGVPVLAYHPVYGDAKIVVPSSFAYVMGDGINDFAVNSLFEPYRTDEADQIINPVDAMGEVSEYLDEETDLELTRVSLELCMIGKGNLNTAWPQETSDAGIVIEPTFHSNDLYEAAPCWIFYFDETVGKEVYACCNALTGEISFVNNGQ